VSYWYQYMGVPSANVGGRQVAGPGDVTTLLPLMAQSFTSGVIIGRNLAVSGSRLGSPGDGTGNIADRAPAYVDPIWANPNSSTGVGGTSAPPNRKYVFTFGGGTNDSWIGGAASVAAYAGLIGSYAGARKATAAVAGYALKFGVCTGLPRNDALEQEANRSAFRALANDPTWRAANNVDFVIDLAAEPTMGLLATCSNTTYYSDGVHPTQAGHAVLAPIYAAAVAPFVT
jgi:hypothetical protein